MICQRCGAENGITMYPEKSCKNCGYILFEKDCLDKFKNKYFIDRKEMVKGDGEMSEELKTLKELYENTADKEIVLVKELKAEAVKWVKYLQLTDSKNLISLSWIINFFDITEEDL